MDGSTVPVREISIKVEHDDVQSDNSASLITGVKSTCMRTDQPVIQPDHAHESYAHEGVLSLGWDEEHYHDRYFPDNIIDGLDNEDLWLLMRRFNKHVFHIKATTKPIPEGDTDFNTAPDEDFTSNKLRAQLERLYMGFLIGMLGFAQHVARLRSWREPRRTALFCITYTLSWFFNFLLPTLFAVIAGLVVFPRLRAVLFPPAPRSMVDLSTGAIMSPPAGILGTTDSATGAPEVRKGETLENEASNFAASIIGTAMNVLNDVVEPQHGDDSEQALAHHYFHDDRAAMEAASAEKSAIQGKRKGSVIKNTGSGMRGDAVKPSMLEPHRLATKVAVAKDKAAGVDRPSRDMSKVPIQKIIWQATRTLTHLLGETCDYWERFENLLNPKLSFSHSRGHLRFASLALTLCLATAIMSGEAICKAIGFVVGVLLFGSPILQPLHNELLKRDIRVRTTLFHGIPTNAQQTITILRLGEAAKTPIPPPPPSSFARTPGASGVSSPPNLLDDPENLATTFNDDPLGASPEELRQAAKIDREQVRDITAHDQVLTDPDTHGKLLGKVFKVLKFGAKTAARTAIAADAARGKVLGSKSAKMRLGCADDDGKDDGKENGLIGPVEFRARHDGKKGFVYVTTDEIGARVCFTRSRGVTVGYDEDDETEDTGRVEMTGRLQPQWSIPVEEIAELNKFSGYGEKAKVLAGWALERAIKDGLQIIDRDGGTRLLTAMPKRDELFNRLCSMGEQRWEIW